MKVNFSQYMEDKLYKCIKTSEVDDVFNECKVENFDLRKDIMIDLIKKKNDFKTKIDLENADYAVVLNIFISNNFYINGGEKGCQ